MIEKALRGFEHVRLPACFLEQQLQRFAHRDVVVDDEHDAFDVRHGDLHPKGCSRRAHSIRPAEDGLLKNGRHAYLF